MTEHDGYMLDAKVEHIKNFAAILSTVRLAKRQHVRVSVTERGLTFVAVDESKTLQAQANFRAEVFKAFSVTPTIGSDSHGCVRLHSVGRIWIHPGAPWKLIISGTIR